MSTYINFISSGLTTPDQIQPSNLRAWFIPDATTMFTDTGGTSGVASDGDAVAHWANQALTANDATQTTADRRPLYRVGVQNGLPALEFGNTDLDNLAADPLASYVNATDAPQTLAMFIKSDIIDWFYCPFAIGVGFGADKWTFRLTTTAFELIKDDNSTTVTRTGGTSDTNPHWVVIVDSGTTVSMWVDGTQIITNGAFDVGPLFNGWSLWTIGCRRVSTVSQSFNGKIGEVVWWDLALSGSEVDDLNTYGQDKWATW